jgi:hypothetical protein
MSRILMRDFQIEARVGVCVVTDSFNRYSSAFALLFILLEDETRIDAAKPEGV